jgi:hypothetical protein
MYVKELKIGVFLIFQRKSELSEAVGDSVQAEQLHRLAQQREQDVMRMLANR